MIEELTADNRTSARGMRSFTGPFVKWGARRLLRWEPEGSILVALPDGQRARFGQKSHENEPFLRVNNYAVLYKIARRGAIGFAEAYIDGDIDSPDLTGVFRFFVRNRTRFEKSGRNLFKVRLGDRLAHLARHNSRIGSRRNISEHYDLGNDFFRLWLDADLNYSSAYYATGSETLEEAQRAKLDLLIDMLGLDGGERILEIGCGWGAFARHVAANCGTSVTGITLSHEQLSHSARLAGIAGLGERCEFRLQDYRDVPGRYDRIVSIEMVEAVGEQYWPRYFEVLHDRLEPGGSAVIQAITIDETRFDRYRRTPDFIQRYVFPGGMLPTPTIIERQAAAAGLKLGSTVRFGKSYARTLREWRARFEAEWPRIAELGFDDCLRRRWRYYLSYCEAGFLEGVIDVGVYRLNRV
jgi:cyclopropane-fatty-acyl-phospholipid synthase